MHRLHKFPCLYLHVQNNENWSTLHLVSVKCELPAAYQRPLFVHVDKTIWPSELVSPDSKKQKNILWIYIFWSLWFTCLGTSLTNTNLKLLLPSKLFNRFVNDNRKITEPFPIQNSKRTEAPLSKSITLKSS